MHCFFQQWPVKSSTHQSIDKNALNFNAFAVQPTTITNGGKKTRPNATKQNCPLMMLGNRETVDSMATFVEKVNRKL